MTTQIVFEQASQRVAIRIIGNNILFIDMTTNTMSPIEGLNFSKEGVIKEHPDLKDDEEWKAKAIQRFVDKVKSFKTEQEKVKWLIKEMQEMDYKGLYKQRNGFRPEKIK